ncbi:hypothetical protein B0T16DRAFT_51455 [Cercophora newfieldiana]|uniref:M-phase inducer phosphatase n=1 Tax=Cercophora newfieldiana TaxID=92897 RepID=A0AA40D1G8_9PEZI|nr:hypothetical protein B0T16DRAFT_51455 [Cercophora newfieldiana]
METSSPLAALRPAPPVFGGRGLFGNRNAHLGPSAFGAGSLNLRDQFNFQRSNNVEYFNVKTVRGSSPAASLAADLSQNFKLNEASSPMFPTPRRALFTTAAVMDSTACGREYVTTPPLPLSSSPGHMDMSMDMMDMSPLPHKAPFVAQIEVPSPSPIPSPTDDMVVEPPAPGQASLEPPKPVVADRRKLGLRRPSLNRAKGYSTGGMSNRLNENQLPPFRFGGDLQPTSTSTTSSMSLSECFQESPPQERRPQSANSPCPPIAAIRSKPHFGSLTSMNSVRNGSPITSHTRRTSNPFMRPRKQFRRSLSMFENPGDVMKPKKEELPAPTMLQSVMDIEEPQEPVLPHFFPPGQNDSIPRISRSTMLEVLDGKFSEQFAHKMIIDCRFEYEYDGGHIDGAINYNDKELLATHLFRTPMEGRTLLIFHCEYSAHRAPIMARHIRAEDRTANAEHYPRLTYPEVYILDGGYSGFFEEHRNRCYPQAYVEMNAAEHVNTCEREMGRLRQNRRGLGRAQTFAFGQHNRTVQDSPTAPGRANSRGMDDMLGASPILGHDRSHARRMVSF